jgi:DNA-binding transcriptional LysR family regulator
MTAPLDIDLLKTFIAIADCGSFTRAAAEVGRTQSAVSMQVRRLEEILDRPLFLRDGRNSRLTGDGERLIEFARRIIRLHDEAMATFDRKALAGLIRFGTPDEYADRFLPEALSRFAVAHPKVQIDVECQKSEALIAMIGRGELDVALITCNAETRGARVVRREPLVWVTSARHDAHLRDPVPLALSLAGCEWRRAALNALDGVGRNYRIAYGSDNSNAVTAAVLAGIAVGAVPAAILRPGMRVLDEREGFPKLETFAIGLVQKSGRLSPAAEALARHIAETLAQFGKAALAA